MHSQAYVDQRQAETISFVQGIIRTVLFLVIGLYFMKKAWRREKKV